MKSIRYLFSGFLIIHLTATQKNFSDMLESYKINSKMYSISFFKSDFSSNVLSIMIGISFFCRACMILFCLVLNNG
ncbi:MAG: hypothetical protein WCG25_00365 [bacterium]